MISFETVLPESASREEWLEARRGFMCSSDSAGVLGLHPQNPPFLIYLDKTKGRKEDSRVRLKRGNQLQDAVLGIYEEETGNKVEKPPKLIRSLEWPFMAASLDSFERQPGIEAPIPVEAKTWAMRKDFGDPGTDQVPDQINVQIQHQMAVAGSPYCKVAVLFAFNEFQVFIIQRNQRVIDKIVEADGDFWQRIVRREAPPLDYEHPLAIECLNQMYGIREGGRITLGSVESMLAEEMRSLKREAAFRLKQAKSIKAQLQECMGDAAFAQLENGGTLSRTMVKRRSYQVHATEYPKLTYKPPKSLIAADVDLDIEEED